MEGNTDFNKSPGSGGLRSQTVKKFATSRWKVDHGKGIRYPKLSQLTEGSHSGTGKDSRVAGIEGEHQS